MLPLFKSCYSLGKSILTFEKDRPDRSIPLMCQEQGLQEVVLVEDGMHGFKRAMTTLKGFGLKGKFGLRLTITDDVNAPELSNDYKLIIFASSGDEAMNDLIEIHNFAQKNAKKKIPCVDLKYLNYQWKKSFTLAVPHYDGIICENTIKDKTCVADLRKFGEFVVFWEDNGVIYDQLLKDKATHFAKAHDAELYKVKSIFYKNRADFLAWQTMKISTSRGNYKGSGMSLNKPGQEFCSSREFCFESWKEGQDAT